jgi:Zn-dependent peptidase ImmA (M78 family)
MFTNSAMPVDRMRYTVAHELAHLILHSLPRADMESEADRFAAEFLMPEADIKPQLRRVTLELLASLKRVWRVSMAALLRRAHQLHTVSAATYQRMWRIFSANGWRRREPPELDLSPESPSTLKELIRFHREDLGYSPSHLGQILHLLPDEFHRMYRFGEGLRLVS